MPNCLAKPKALYAIDKTKVNSLSTTTLFSGHTLNIPAPMISAAVAAWISLPCWSASSNALSPDRCALHHSFEGNRPLGSSNHVVQRMLGGYDDLLHYELGCSAGFGIGRRQAAVTDHRLMIRRMNTRPVSAVRSSSAVYRCTLTSVSPGRDTQWSV